MTDDYRRIEQIIGVVENHWRRHPTREEVADAVGLTTADVHELVQRWGGMSYDALLQRLEPDLTRRRLAADAGLFGPKDGAPALGEAVPDFHVEVHPIAGAAGPRGAGLVLRHGLHPSPFGPALVVAAEDTLVGLGFADRGPFRDPIDPLEDMVRRWPSASWNADLDGTSALARRIFDPQAWLADDPLRLALIGTEFEQRIWLGLLRIPMGHLATYSALAAHIGAPTAARAVGAAVGRNPISFIVPCHRVVGRSGDLTGYYWGLQRKRAILAWEFAQAGVS